MKAISEKQDCGTDKGDGIECSAWSLRFFALCAVDFGHSRPRTQTGWRFFRRDDMSYALTLDLPSLATIIIYQRYRTKMSGLLVFENASLRLETDTYPFY